MNIPAGRWRGLSPVDAPVTGVSMLPRLVCLLGFCFACGAAAVVTAAEWPAKPIRMIVPFPPGGGTDLVGRAASNALSGAVGQPVVVDNRGGAGDKIGRRAVGDNWVVITS